MTSSRPPSDPSDPLLSKPPLGDPMHANVAALRTQLAAVVEESRAFRREVEEVQRAQAAKDAARDRQRRRENTIAAGAAVAMAVPIILMLFLVVQGVDTARNAARSAEEARKTTDYIASCTTPSGACYRDSNKRQSGAMQVIRNSTGNVVWCAKVTSTKAAQDRCVAELEKAAMPR